MYTNHLILVSQNNLRNIQITHMRIDQRNYYKEILSVNFINRHLRKKDMNNILYIFASLLIALIIHWFYFIHILYFEDFVVCNILNHILPVILIKRHFIC